MTYRPDDDEATRKPSGAGGDASPPPNAGGSVPPAGDGPQYPPGGTAGGGAPHGAASGWRHGGWQHDGWQHGGWRPGAWQRTGTGTWPPPAARPATTPFPTGHRGWRGWHGWSWPSAWRPAVPDWVGADIERRAVDREARETTRYARRASWTAKAWAAFAAITPAFAAAAGDWLWLSVGGAALVNGGLWAQEAIRARRRTPELPVPRQPAPSAAALRGSAAAGPLRRGEAAMRAFTSLLKAAPPGAAEDALRSGMAAAAEVVDGLRVRASSVVACEGAARALTNPAGRAELDSTIQELVTEMEAAVRALDDLLGAAAEVVGVARASAARAGQDVIAGTPTGRLGPGQLGAASLGPDLAALSERAASLRAYAAGLRELTTDPTTAKAFPPPTQPPAG